MYINGTDVKGRVSEFDKIGFEWVDEVFERDLLNPTKRHTIQLHSYVDVFDESGLNHEKSHTLVTHIGFHTLKRSGFKAKLGDGVGEGLWRRDPDHRIRRLCRYLQRQWRAGLAFLILPVRAVLSARMPLA